MLTEKRIKELTINAHDNDGAMFGSIMDAIRTAALESEREALERAAKVCDAKFDEWHAEYKTPGGPNRCNPHTEGMADGADLMGQAIRKLLLADSSIK